MVSRFKKNSMITLGSMILVMAISLAGLSGCSSKGLTGESAANTEVTVDKDANTGNTQNTVKTTAASTSANLETTLQSTSDQTSKESGKPENESKDNTDNSSLASYISLLGLSKDKLADTLNEKPVSVDEGGLEFKKAGIRVWFDPESGKSVSQVFTTSKDIDLNGVRIGDKIDKFKKAFGEPVSDNNGDMHFKYKDVFLSINYDTKTGETYALYILKKDF